MAEFFAGIGLVRMGLEQDGFRVVFANDIAEPKRRLYSANFEDVDYLLKDIRQVRAGDIPDVELATASFPCTDLSLAGNRAGLEGSESGTFWEFARILGEMGARRPPLILLENVAGWSTSAGGQDLRRAVNRLNELGYTCDPFVVDARWFVPQSRPRLFIVGSQGRIAFRTQARASLLRPQWILRFAEVNPDLLMGQYPLPDPPQLGTSIASVVERCGPGDERWWDRERLDRFLSSLSQLNRDRLGLLRSRDRKSWRTAYRRTRNGSPVWEIRADPISGCLRTARGGSSRQALVEAGNGKVRVRWMTPREYARLQGAPRFRIQGVGENRAIFGLGDAVCVPVIDWIARNYLRPALAGVTTTPVAAVPDSVAVA